MSRLYVNRIRNFMIVFVITCGFTCLAISNMGTPPCGRRSGTGATLSAFSWRVLASLGSVAASSIRPGVPRESPERPSLAGPPRESARIYLLGPIPAVPSISLVWFGVRDHLLVMQIRPPLSIPSSANTFRRCVCIFTRRLRRPFGQPFITVAR